MSNPYSHPQPSSQPSQSNELDQLTQPLPTHIHNNEASDEIVGSSGSLPDSSEDVADSPQLDVMPDVEQMLQQAGAHIESVDNPYDADVQQQQQQQQHHHSSSQPNSSHYPSSHHSSSNPIDDLSYSTSTSSSSTFPFPPHSDRTFITGVEPSSFSSSFPSSSSTDFKISSPSQLPISDEALISHIESQMLEYERTAQYLEAEKARQHLNSLKSAYKSGRVSELNKIQEEDIQIFFQMVSQHQTAFDTTWNKKTLEHKIRADDLINALKWKHDQQQRELYEILKKKRLPKFSVELLNMRKRQVLLAKSKNYIAAEKIKRKADMLEAIEIERIREQAKQENQFKFTTLLKKQEWDRKSLAEKLKIEKKCLIEAKSQDFIRLKKRLKNAEQELKKTHARQQLIADKKLIPLYASNGSKVGAGGSPTNGRTSMSTGVYESSQQRGSSLRNTGRNASGISGSTSGLSGTGSNGSYTSREFKTNESDVTTITASGSSTARTHRSVKELAKVGRG